MKVEKDDDVKTIYECDSCGARAKAGSEEFLNGWHKTGLCWPNDISPEPSYWCPKCFEARRYEKR